MTMDEQIGFVVIKVAGFAVECMDCAISTNDGRPADQGCKLYRASVHPYRQTCHTCGKVMNESAFCELYDKPQPEPSNPDSAGFYVWTVELRVNKEWVADGYDPTDEDVERMLQKRLPYAYGHEVSARVLTRPSDAVMAYAQGYGTDVERYKKARDK